MTRMKFLVPLFVCAALALAPAMACAQSYDGQDRHWRDGNGQPQGRGYPSQGRGDPRGRYEPEGRPRGGPLYAAPPQQTEPQQGRPHERRGPNSLGEGWSEQQAEARQGRLQGRFVPLASVLPGIARRVPGRQLDAGLEQGNGGQPNYRVRWAAQDGRRIDFIVDARTGQILSSEGQ